MISGERENWYVTNLTKKTLSIGDLPAVPTFAPGETHDILQFYTREKATKSKLLPQLIQQRVLSLRKKSDDSKKIRSVSAKKAQSATTPADMIDVESSSGGGGGTGDAEEAIRRSWSGL